MIAPYYQDSRVTIYCAKAERLVVNLGPVDHVISDCPYSKRVEVGARSRKGLAATQLGGDLPSIDFGSITYPALRRLLGNIGCRRWMIMTVDIGHAVDLDRKPPEGMRAVRIGAWVKPNGAPQFTGDRPAQGWEAVSILHAADERLRWNSGGDRAVWTHNVVHGGEHPTEKPLGLMKEWIQQFTDPGDLILDPFMGSGTTLLACKELGRRAIGIERLEKYCEVAARRMSQEVLAFGP